MRARREIDLNPAALSVPAASRDPGAPWVAHGVIADEVAVPAASHAVAALGHGFLEPGVTEPADALPARDAAGVPAVAAVAKASVQEPAEDALAEPDALEPRGSAADVAQAAAGAASDVALQEDWMERDAPVGPVALDVPVDWVGFAERVHAAQVDWGAPLEHEIPGSADWGELAEKVRSAPASRAPLHRASVRIEGLAVVAAPLDGFLRGWLETKDATWGPALAPSHCGQPLAAAPQPLPAGAHDSLPQN